jgi:hypothetical protein
MLEELEIKIGVMDQLRQIFNRVGIVMRRR